MSLMCLPQSVYIPQVHQVYLCMFRLRSLDAVVPSLGYGLLASRMRARASYGTNVQHIMMIQSYPYLNATKDRLLRNGSAWALSGDNKSHRNNRYRHMRILCAFLTIIVTRFSVAGCAYRMILDIHFYNCIPLLLSHSLNSVLTHRLLL
jgi:hypothetical protein